MTIHLTPRRPLLGAVLAQCGQYRSTHQRVQHQRSNQRTEEVHARGDEQDQGQVLRSHHPMLAKAAFVASGSVLALAIAAASLVVYR